jgi:phage shock protein A
MPDEQESSADTPESPEDESTIASAVETVLPAPDPGYDAHGVPTFDAVREKIETRYGTAIGATELAEETPEGRSVAEQYEARERAAAERLQQIRESMSKDES